jgi:hypothetical protein
MNKIKILFLIINIIFTVILHKFNFSLLCPRKVIQCTNDTIIKKHFHLKKFLRLFCHLMITIDHKHHHHLSFASSFTSLLTLS